MSFEPMHPASWLRFPPLALVLLAAAGRPAAQVRGNTSTSEGEKEMQEAKQLEQQKLEQIAVDGTDGDSKAAAPVAMNPAALANLVYAHVNTRPRRLAPGESGLLVVVLALHTPAVIPGDAAVSLTYEPRQGPLSLGTFSVLPATPGTLETKFKGQLVHDNTLTVEVPLTIAPDAGFGEASVSLNLATTVANGSTGVGMGALALPIPGKVKIGKSVPRPFAHDDGTGASASAAELRAPTRSVDAPANATEGVSPPPEVDGTAAALNATSIDGIALAVTLDRPSLRPGESLEAQVEVRVPAGKALVRTDGALRLEVEGVDAGVTAVVGEWPEPTIERVGDGEVEVSRGSLSVPVSFTAARDAVIGLRRLQFCLNYSTVGSGSTAPSVLQLPAVLSVGAEPTIASPWPFYLAGVGLALLLAFVVLRVVRR